MKTKLISSIISVTVLALFTTSCSESLSGIEESMAMSSVEKSINTSSGTKALDPGCCTLSGSLKESEIEGLMKMREEEKLARDVYTYFYSVHEHLIFNNISKSESAHMSAVLFLINGYGLEDPAVEGTGKFSDPAVDGLFNDLTGKGSDNLTEALKVGVYIEELDINDLQNILSDTGNADLIRVYNNLLRGSKFHLKAFTNVLSRLGESYSPEILSADQYQDILDSTDQQGIGETGFNFGDCDQTGPGQ